MWSKVASFIIKFKLPMIVVIGLITVVMGYHATKVEMSYEFTRTVPLDDPDMVFFQRFKKQFGEDGNMMAIGVKDSALFKLENFQKFRTLSNNLRKIEGVGEVLSLPLLKLILKDTVKQKFYLGNVFPENVTSQQQLDSLLTIANGQKFYVGRLMNPTNGATLVLAQVKKEYANSAKRIDITNALVKAGDEFAQQTGIQVHYAGLPFVRSVMASQVRKELSFFLYLSAMVTGLIMLIFFRSVRAVIFSMIMIEVVVQKMGLATFLTNLTVAIGFLTLLYTDITILREFGIVAGINIIGLFVVSLVMIPSILSWMPEPKPNHLRHLNFKIL